MSQLAHALESGTFHCSCSSHTDDHLLVLWRSQYVFNPSQVKKVVSVEIVIRVSGVQEIITRIEGGTEFILHLQHTSDDLVKDVNTIILSIFITFSDDHDSSIGVH